MIVETDRLILREMTQADYPELAAMLQDTEVMAAYDHAFTDADVQQWLERQRRRYKEDGFGLWAAVRRDTGEMIGQAGLTWQPCEDDKVLEIGYLLKKAHWHRGYAREAALGCRRYAFDVLGADAVHSIIRTDNLASIRVAEAVGMQRVKTFLTRYYGGEQVHYLYRLQRQP